MLPILGLLIGSALSANAHPFHRHLLRRQIERIFTGPPYPTGPAFDVPPFEQIKQLAPEELAPTAPLPREFAAGEIPTALGPNAVGLPDLTGFDASLYPPLDQVPSIDSPEVQEWLKEIEGADIPDYAPTKDGTCASDPEAAAQAGADGRCWWTCSGGCTRPTDISGCDNRANWGVTFDDGPSLATPKLLHYLESIDTKATFYVVGSRVVSNPQILQAELMLGHELAIHTWSHSALTTLTNEQLVAEFGWTRKAIKDVAGVTPLYMRPPFGDIDDRVRAVANAMGLIPVLWTFADKDHPLDTFDYNVAGSVDTAINTVTNFRNSISIAEEVLNHGIITLEHDLLQEEVDLAISAHLPDALTRAGPRGIEGGWKLGNVAQCLAMPPGDSYLETTTNQTIIDKFGGKGGVQPQPLPPVQPPVEPPVSGGDSSSAVPEVSSSAEVPIGSSEVILPSSSGAIYEPSGVYTYVPGGAYTTSAAHPEVTGTYTAPEVAPTGVYVEEPDRYYQYQGGDWVQDPAGDYVLAPNGDYVPYSPPEPVYHTTTVIYTSEGAVYTTTTEVAVPAQETPEAQPGAPQGGQQELVLSQVGSFPEGGGVATPSAEAGPDVSSVPNVAFQNEADAANNSSGERVGWTTMTSLGVSVILIGMNFMA